MAEGFTCAVPNEKYRSACKDLPKYSGSRYCVLHEPDEAKDKEDFLKVKKSKLDRKDYDFGGAVFPEGTSNFERYEFDENVAFTGADFIGTADFTKAQFSGESTSFENVRCYGGSTSFEGAQFSSESTSFENAEVVGKSTDFTAARFSGKSTSFSGARLSSVRTDFTAAQFSGDETYFGDAQFSGDETYFVAAQFSGERTYFTRARFSGQGTNFSGAQFSGEMTAFFGAQFNSSEGTFFEGTQFSSERTDFTAAQFGGKSTDFTAARFSSEGTDFILAKFDSTSTLFSQTSFEKEVAFREATFGEQVAFWGTKENPTFASEAWARFDSVRIEKPELLAFNNVLLHPGWFINTDMRKVDFTDVKWYGMPGGPKGTLNKEIDKLKKRDIESPHYLLAQACRRLSANAEENREYPLANEFHYWSMNALRKQGWTRLGLIGTLYWALSGYGVRAARAFGWLVVIWVVFALLYVLMGSSELHVFSASEAWKYVAQHIRTNPLGLRAPSHYEIKHFWADVRPALVYSLGALARLRPEPQPDGPSWFQFFVTVEGILGPLQVALLALAIRRKVMR